MMTPTILGLLAKATVVMTVALLGTRLAKRTRASVRHVLLTAAFASLVLLPIVSPIAPAIPVAIPIVASGEPLAPLGDSITDDAARLADGSGARVSPPALARTATPSMSTVLLGTWLAGTLAFLVPVIAGLWQVRALRRTALPWLEGRPLVIALAADARIRQPIDLLLHETLAGPMTCGVLHPVIILPIDAPAWSAEDLRRAVVHELEHVRRGDWLSQCGARIVAACYWFHPIVWIAWRQLALEAERACDDAVVASASTATNAESDATTAYADQLVGLARKLSTGGEQPQLAMANRHDLTTRIIALLDTKQPRGRAGALCVGAAIAVTAVLGIGLSSIRIVAASSAPAQAPVNKPRYDAASIKPCVAEENPTGARGTAGGTNATFSPGRFYVPCVTTEQLIYLAYASYGAREDERLVNDDAGTASNATKIRGGPAWVHSLRDKYSIEATAAGATERTVLMGAMLQSLLEDRFHLKIHRDTEEVPLLWLTVAKSGLKLKPMKDGDCDPDADVFAAPGGKPKCGMLQMGGSPDTFKWTFNGFALSSLASQLSRTLGVHVVDKTGITDKFLFQFEFNRDGAGAGDSASAFTAVEEQLGLKLEKTKGPRGFLAIDAIERPTPDGPTVYISVPTRAQGPGGRRR